MSGPTKDARKQNQLFKVNIFSKILFLWLRHLFLYVSKHDLKDKDLYVIPNEDRSTILMRKLDMVWSKEYYHKSELGKKAKPRLSRCLMKVYGRKFIFWAAVSFAFAIIQMIQPLILEQIVLYFQPASKISSIQACFFVSLCIVLTVTFTILRRNAFFYLTRLGLNMRIACSSIIFKKLLLSPSSPIDKNASVSGINLLSTDVIKFETMMCYLPFVLIVPMQLMVATYFIYRCVGIIAASIGCSLLILQSLPVQAIYYKYTIKFRAQQAAQTDKRVSLISEVINGIRAVKMYVWEKYFVNLVYMARKSEIGVFLKMSYLTSFTLSTVHYAHRICIFAMVLTHSLQNELIFVNKLIPVTVYLSTLRDSLNSVFFLCVRSLADGSAAIKRIENFLSREELKHNKKKPSVENKEAISMKNVTASWDSKINENMPRDINLDIQRDQLCVILGSVGAGKTTLLKVIMSELYPISGEIDVNGQISYASQEPWLFNGSIKDNIIFGGKYDKDKYKKVIEACALLEDFNTLPYGDKTLVGEKGMSLSGGQCARVNLARAVYRDADIYLLDDPLSAVDSRVAKKLMENCIHELLKKKTRILVTHNIQFLHKAEKIILLNKGLIQYQGTFSEFQSTDYYFHYSSSIEENLTAIELPDVSEMKNPMIVLNSSVDENEGNEPKETEELLIKSGSSRSLFFKYVQSSQSYSSVVVLIFSSLIVIGSCAGFDYWVITWTQTQQSLRENLFDFKNQTIVDNSKTQGLHDLNTFLYVSTSLVTGIVIFSVMKNLFLHKFAFHASRNIHNSMFACLISAPLKFFETNPAGRIINRFSEDTISVDDFFARAKLEFSDQCILISALFIPVMVIFWWHIFTITFYIFLCFKLFQLCMPTVRSTKKLAGVAVSQILSFANSSLAGITTIRSHRAENIVFNDFHRRLDRFTSAQLLHIASVMGFSIWVDLLTPMLFGVVAYSTFAFKSDGMMAGHIGMSIMQVFNLSMMVSHAMRMLSDSLSYMVNLERMFEYTKLQTENLDESESGVKPPLFWPFKGELRFDHVSLRYSDNEGPVLKDINFTIEPGMKVGIVGRTGAGKSSLISALFRTVNTDGTILIDSVDIKKISLSDLRSKLSIIPQEPILFKASLRCNLDPFNQFDDAVLWSALESVELKKIFSSLEYSIDKAGQNLSLGQRQLLCLARAVIRRNRILVLDEATANVDHNTDSIIQKTIRDKFRKCTVLTIAHRLNTVVDCDRVLVMNDGRVVEYDHPHVLLQKAEGSFLDMVLQTGDKMSRHLKEVAKQAYDKREEKHL